MSPSPDISSVSPTFDSLTLRFLHEALSVEGLLSGAIYTHDPVSSTYAISGTFGIEPGLVDQVRTDLVFSVGDKRGLVGKVALTREPMYLADFDAEASWFNEKGVIHVGSVYIVPIVSGEGLPAIVTVISAVVSAFSSELRAAIDCLADFASRVFRAEAAVRSRVREIQRDMRSVSVEWGALLDTLDAAKPPSEVSTPLRALSRREWEVVERLQAGQRSTTIARALGISLNTVRNHVKSVSRKLGVRSQSELREFIGGLRERAEARDEDNR